MEENNGSAWGDIDVAPTVDSKGRMNPEAMSDRELLIEAVTTMRATQDLVTEFIAAMEKNPMLKSMAGMFGMGKKV